MWIQYEPGIFYAPMSITFLEQRKKEARVLLPTGSSYRAKVQDQVVSLREAIATDLERGILWVKTSSESYLHVSPYGVIFEPGSNVARVNYGADRVALLKGQQAVEVRVWLEKRCINRHKHQVTP